MITHNGKTYKVVVCTPAGRKRYMEILFYYILKQRHIIDEYRIWVNTKNQDDINWFEKLKSSNQGFVTTEYLPDNTMADFLNHNVHKFFKNTISADTIYVRFDDDIVWMEKDYIEKIVKFRIENPEYFIVFGNIINNAIIDHIHQRLGCLNIPFKLGYHFLDGIGWGDGKVAEIKHREFLTALKKNKKDTYKFKKWELLHYEAVSINSFCYFGSEFAKFNGVVDINDEGWLSAVKPMEIKKYNIIYGEAMCSHFSFCPQREHMDKTSILSKYRKLANMANIEPKKKYFTKEQLLNKIFEAKLFDCGGKVYATEYDHALSKNSGVWQQPEELANLLLFLQEKEIKNFLDIGTFNGITFNLISDVLNTFRNVNCITVDPFDHNKVKNEKYTYQQTTSDYYKNQVFDLVFIDGDHSYECSKNDYLNVGQYAKYCVFHDINDIFVRSNNGGVCRLWEEIKTTKKHIEFNCSKKPVQVMGIGVLVNDGS